VVLVDTSLWIEVFRRRPRLALESLADPAEVATCLPIVQEVLQGIDDERAFRTARAGMLSLHVIESPLAAGVFEEAAQLFRAARRAGVTVRSSVDCVIAACAIRHDIEVLHRDRDYAALARVSSLRQREV
jgi:hypothetical protein